MKLNSHHQATFLRDIDKLISQGDQLFRTNTIESINEAKQLYVLALHMLNDSYFLSLNTINNRLFKIQQCLSINRVSGSFPLFGPIDPANIAKSVAACVDLDSIHRSGLLMLPSMRFGFVVQKAAELCAEVNRLGGTFLSAIEKCDTEEIARLRSRYEMPLLSMVSMAKEYQAEEAMKILEVLEIRIQDSWVRPVKMAEKEKGQIRKQDESATMRAIFAEQEIKIHDLQLEIANTTERLMRSMFTEHELYDWNVGRITNVYIQSYQAAHGLASRAEKAFRCEYDVKNLDFIQIGNLDSLKNALLAGEQLHCDIKRMEIAYCEQKRRELEINKDISLNQHAPLELSRLKQNGRCVLSLPEALFDLDFPGHYFRRIKSVWISIPCVVGPYAGVYCKMSLLKSKIRVSDRMTRNRFAKNDGIDESSFTHSIEVDSSTLACREQTHSGTLETDLAENRILPFEGAGAISEWEIELTPMYGEFDYEGITDFILHVQYTARDTRDGG